MGMTIGGLLEKIAAKYPDNDAVVSVHQDIRWTYREFLARVNGIARSLMGLGVEKGDRVGIWVMLRLHNFSGHVSCRFVLKKQIH